MNVQGRNGLCRKGNDTMKEMTFALILGYLMDLILGDPHNLWHPVCGIGKLIQVTEKGMRKCFGSGKQKERLAGICLVVIVVVVSVAIPWGLLWVAGILHPYLKLALMSVMCCQILATKSLKDESMKVYEKLAMKDLPGARQAVSMIVGRDTQSLTEEGVTKATVETIAENASDGIIAPLFYLAIGGPVLGFFYKAVNTMDSMVGYKNEKYQYFGWAAAKLDDVVNFIPARLAAFLMILGSGILGMDLGNAWKIYSRDRGNHASPNSAHTEAVMAGALRVQLAGDAYYFGKLYKKKTIGDAIRRIEPEDIRRANRLLYMTSFLAVVLVVALQLWIR